MSRLQRVMSFVVLMTALMGTANASAVTVTARDQNEYLTCEEGRYAWNLYFGYTINSTNCEHIAGDRGRNWYCSTSGYVYNVRKTRKTFFTSYYYEEPYRFYSPGACG